MAVATIGKFKISYRENSADEGVLRLYSFENDCYFKKVPEYHPKADHTIIDVGAHIGTFSLLAASKVPQGKVFAIEASQDTFDYLKKNIEMNGFKNIISERLALCNKSGTIRLYHDLTDGNWGDTIVKKVSESFEDCPCDTLEGFLKSHNIACCNFLKINCEGAEFGIILSTPKQTLRKIRVLHISYHSDLAEGCSENELMKYLQNAGFYVRKVPTGEKRGWLIAIRAGLLLRAGYTLRDRINSIVKIAYRALEYRLIKPLILKGFIKKLLHIDDHSSAPQGDAKESTASPAKYGSLNPDKIIYIIRQTPGRGLLSLVSSVICHLHFTEGSGLIPVIDFKNYKTEYNDPEFDSSDASGSLNAWEYYFEPVSGISLDEAYHSEKVILSEFAYPKNYRDIITREPKVNDTGAKYIRIKPELAEEIESSYKRMLAGHKVLGVHFRGQDMKFMSNHFFPPSKKQMKYAIDIALKDVGFDRIFVVTEDADYLDYLEKVYGSMVVSMPHYRTSEPVNAYKIYPRPMHKYLLGKEVLIDTMLLARCQGLVSSISNVSEMARYFSQGRYEADVVIDNGHNSSSKKIAKYLWKVRDLLPEGLGGFSLKAIGKNPWLS